MSSVFFFFPSCHIHVGVVFPLFSLDFPIALVVSLTNLGVNLNTLLVMQVGWLSFHPKFRDMVVDLLYLDPNCSESNTRIPVLVFIKV